MILILGIGIFVFTAILTVFEWRRSEDKKSYLVKNISGLVAALVLLFLFGPLFSLSPLKIGYRTEKIENKTIIYPRGWETQKEQFVRLVNQAEQTILEFYPEQFPVTLILTRSNFDLFRFTGQRGGGNNSLGHVYISGSYMDEGLITAELSHYYLFKTADRPSLYFPRWFDEGLAVYLGHSGSLAKFTQPEPLQRLLEDSRYPKNLDGWRGFGGQLRWMKQIYTGGYVTHMYTHSYYLVRLLVEEYGLGKLQNLVTGLKTSSSFETAFQEVYGLSTDRFGKQFVDSALREFSGEFER